MDGHNELNWQDVTRRVKGRMLDCDIRTADDLSQLSGLNRSSLSLKMTGKRKWRIEDLQALATVLNTTVSYLIGDTDQAVAAEASSLQVIAPPHEELHRRLTFLEAPEADRAIQDGSQPGSAFPHAELERIAIRHNVPVEYLTHFDDAEAADRIEAMIDFSAAIVESGVQRIAARSLGALSAEELRALTRVIRQR